jgi:hypothetical protein
MKKSRSKLLKIVDEKHDINFHWPQVTLSIQHLWVVFVNQRIGKNSSDEYDLLCFWPVSIISPRKTLILLPHNHMCR